MKPARLEYLHKWPKQPSVKVLYIGCRNHSPSRIKPYYPRCLYYGVDENRLHGLDENDFKCMEGFFELHLASHNALDKIPNGFFNCIIMSHVLEHLKNGKEVLENLVKKLHSKGIIYIEFPSPHSAYLPHMQGTLNFYDDPSHVRLYSRKDLEKLLLSLECSIQRSRIRRNIKRIFSRHFTPPTIRCHLKASMAVFFGTLLVLPLI